MMRIVGAGRTRRAGGMGRLAKGTRKRAIVVVYEATIVTVIYVVFGKGGCEFSKKLYDLGRLNDEKQMRRMFVKRLILRRSAQPAGNSSRNGGPPAPQVSSRRGSSPTLCTLTIH